VENDEKHKSIGFKKAEERKMRGCKKEAV